MTPSSPLAPESIDAGLIWDLFERFVAVDTCARVGENRVPPDDPRVTTFAHEVAAPALRESGATVTVDGLNNVVARFGEERGTELLFVAYPAAHHGQGMEEPLRARRDEVNGEERWIGLGASQSKGALAALCAAARELQERDVDLGGRLTLAVSSEGSSTHASARELFAGFRRLPRGAVLVVGTENRITLGNRGRVDVVVDVYGRSTHSSSPQLGTNPIPVVAEVQRRLAALHLDPAPHERLGPRALVPYKLVCGPVAPHTIPDWCTLVVDRRTLPGDDEDAIVAEIAELLEDLPVTVSRGASMLPALVSDAADVVLALQAGARHALGRPLETFYPPYTFDAGYPCSLGVPTVMCGPSSSDFGGPDVLGADFVLLRHLREAAAVFAGAAATGG
jgi:succinyl-diaminopimelate desuccinylase